MTIHIPRWLLIGLGVLIVAAGAGYGGYRYGLDKGNEDGDAAAGSRAAQEQADASEALLTHHRYEVAMLRAACRYADRLRDPQTGQRLRMPFGCTGITPPASHVTI